MPDLYMARACMACGKEADERDMVAVGTGFAHPNCVLSAVVGLVGVAEVRTALRALSRRP